MKIDIMNISKLIQDIVSFHVMQDTCHFNLIYSKTFSSFKAWKKTHNNFLIMQNSTIIFIKNKELYQKIIKYVYMHTKKKIIICKFYMRQRTK